MSKGLNRTLKVYSELDTWFDYRRGLLQHLMTKDKRYLNDQARQVDGDQMWDLYYRDRYKARRMDDFSLPELGITNEDFAKAYRDRHIGNFGMFYSSALYHTVLKMIFDVEMLEDNAPSIRGAILYVNYFPYDLDEDLQALLADSLNRRLKGRFDIRLTNVDPRSLTATHFGQYDYVFKYELLKDDYQWFMKSLEEVPIPQTTFFLPALFKSVNNMIVGTPEDMLYSIAASLSPVIKIIPCNPAVYDYDDPT